MCWKCKHVLKEIERLEKHFVTQANSLHGRKKYYADYYKKNREKKINQALERYHAKKVNRSHPNDSALTD